LNVLGGVRKCLPLENVSGKSDGGGVGYWPDDPRAAPRLPGRCKHPSPPPLTPTNRRGCQREKRGNPFKSLLRSEGIPSGCPMITKPELLANLPMPQVQDSRTLCALQPSKALVPLGRQRADRQTTQRALMPGGSCCLACKVWVATAVLRLLCCSRLPVLRRWPCGSGPSTIAWRVLPERMRAFFQQAHPAGLARLEVWKIGTPGALGHSAGAGVG